jgi:hypothetical protein
VSKVPSFTGIAFRLSIDHSGTSDIIGSPGKLWDLLQDANALAPVEGNTDGSYVTMKSNSGILFAGCKFRSSGVWIDGFAADL